MDDDMETPASGSPLSDIDSDEFQEEKFVARSRSNSGLSTISASSNGSAESIPRHLGMPPAKRRKTGASSYDHATPQSASTAMPLRSPSGSISSDSSGSVPTSPSFAHLGPTHPLSSAYAAAQANPENPEMADYVQVTRCLWQDCGEPEQGNMDNLVNHINDVHIVPRQKKYFCDWQGCGRKGQPHTSAYALKAHMRSHTKEKPFMCALPECDRSFTRSDALAKHMRTVHETEALRPSDPVPKGHTGGISNGGVTANGGIKRIKLIMGGGVNGEKRPSLVGDLPPLPTVHTLAALGMTAEDLEMSGHDSSDELIDAVDIDSIKFALPVPPDYYPEDVWEGMDEYERNLPPSQFFRLLRRQIHWAEEDGRDLAKELAEERARTEDSRGHVIRRGAGDEKGGDANRKVEWQQTETILDAVLRAEAGKVMEMFTGKRADGDEQQKPWQMIQSLNGLARHAT